MNQQTTPWGSLAYLTVTLLTGICLLPQSANGQISRLPDIQLGPAPNQVNNQGFRGQNKQRIGNTRGGIQNVGNRNQGGANIGAPINRQNQNNIQQVMIQQAIQQFDRDGDQKLDATELSAMLNMLQLQQQGRPQANQPGTMQEAQRGNRRTNQGTGTQSINSPPRGRGGQSRARK